MANGLDDVIDYFSGWVYHRKFRKWIDGVGYDLDIGREGGGLSFVSWRILPRENEACTLRIAVYPHVLQRIPPVIRWLPHSWKLQLRRQHQGNKYHLIWQIQSSQRYILLFDLLQSQSTLTSAIKARNKENRRVSGVIVDAKGDLDNLLRELSEAKNNLGFGIMVGVAILVMVFLSQQLMPTGYAWISFLVIIIGVFCVAPFNQRLEECS